MHAGVFMPALAQFYKQKQDYLVRDMKVHSTGTEYSLDPCKCWYFFVHDNGLDLRPQLYET